MWTAENRPRYNRDRLRSGPQVRRPVTLGGISGIAAAFRGGGRCGGPAARLEAGQGHRPLKAPPRSHGRRSDEGHGLAAAHGAGNVRGRFEEETSPEARFRQGTAGPGLSYRRRGRGMSSASAYHRTRRTEETAGDGFGAERWLE